MKIIIAALFTTLFAISSFGSGMTILINGTVTDQCVLSLDASPTANEIGVILAHITGASVINFPISINCNQAGLAISAQATYGSLRYIANPASSIDYTAEVIGSNISSVGLKTATSLLAKTTMGTTLAGIGSSSFLKIHPIAPASAASPGNYQEYIVITVTSL